MNWILITSALGAALMGAVGFDLLVPIGRMIGDLCAFGAVGFVMVVVGLADGA